MKSFLIKLTAISIGIIFILSIGAVLALNPDEASVITIWEGSPYYQGDTASVKAVFQSYIAYELEITRVSIHFDWMPSDAFYSYDLSANPVTIPGNGSYTFELTNIRFLAGASAGLHSYFVSVDGLQNGFGFIWNSPSSTIQIHSGNEKLYYELEPQVTSQINNATYENAQAQSLLQQAKNEYAQALSFAENGEWQEAVRSLQEASDYLEQAETAEQTGGGQNSAQCWLLYLVIIFVVVVIAVVVIVVVVRRKSKKPESVSETMPNL